jgi:hypothetical protein
MPHGRPFCCVRRSSSPAAFLTQTTLASIERHDGSVKKAADYHASKSSANSKWGARRIQPDSSGSSRGLTIA